MIFALFFAPDEGAFFKLSQAFFFASFLYMLIEITMLCFNKAQLVELRYFAHPQFRPNVIAPESDLCRSPGFTRSLYRYFPESRRAIPTPNIRSYCLGFRRNTPLDCFFLKPSVTQPPFIVSARRKFLRSTLS